MSCLFCHRDLPLTFHHLIPKSLHKKQWIKRRFTKNSLQDGILICRDCHDALHKMISRKECATTYNSCEKILQHPDFSNFVRWVKKQNKTSKRFCKPSKRFWGVPSTFCGCFANRIRKSCENL